MTTIVTRAGKGSPLTNAEMDTNLTNLNTAKLEQTGNTNIGFAATGGSPSERNFSWNDTDGTLDLGLKGGNVSLQIGQEQVLRCLNNTGNALVDGQVVYVSGAQGNRTTIALANGNSEATSQGTIGVVTEPIANNQEGFVTLSGLVRGINTSSFTEGAALYLSATTAGGITTTAPVAPNHSVRLGWCVRSHTTLGSILVSVQNGYELDEIHDVLITTPVAGQLLKRNTANTLWENGNTNLGNLAIGKALEAWTSSVSVLEVSGATLYANTLTSILANNYFVNSGATPIIISNGRALAYHQNSDGSHVFKTSQSGNAGDTATFVTALSIDASGNLTPAGAVALTKGYSETIYTLVGTDIASTNGSVQTKTLSANTTFTSSLATGNSVTLMLNPATYTVTWPTITWISTTGNVTPTLTASVMNTIVLWNIAGTLYGNYLGHA